MKRNLFLFQNKIKKNTIPRFFSTNEKQIEINIDSSYKTHLFEHIPKKTYTTKSELLEYFEIMNKMRRMEIICDNSYKDREIRGFCHLYDGQEATATGINAAFTNEDCWITSYRCHCIALIRGSSVFNILSELYGMKDGSTQGKGGSMHFYNKKHNFYGGQGIVGAQVPVGAGLAFACKYNTPLGEEMPVALAAYGDGAANQGQIWESANMASLWKLPLILCIENNKYGMGTSIERHSCNGNYYTMGNTIPGIKIDGNNVFAVREGMKMIKNYCSTGNGPVYVEMDTYRYHGHSMSDPGVGYRSRDEVIETRKQRDPIEYIKNIIIENDIMSEKEIKNLEKEIRSSVDKEAEKAKKGSQPNNEDLYSYIYSDGNGGNELLPFIRMPELEKSIKNNK